LHYFHGNFSIETVHFYSAIGTDREPQIYRLINSLTDIALFLKN
jgi:hypothetical protein